MHASWPPKLYRGPTSTAHPYPLEIAFHATIFMVGATFYYAFADVAVGEYLVLSPAPYDNIRTKFLARGVTAQAWEDNWKAFEAYLKTFPNPVVQNALFGMVMHWDWYISKLGKFVEFAREYVASPGLSPKLQGALRRVAFKSISEQIEVLSQATGLPFSSNAIPLAVLTEMDLVRNLGMHNQWRVDGYYLAHTQEKRWALGAQREVTVPDLERWRAALSDAIHHTSTGIARKFVAAPDYSASD